MSEFIEPFLCDLEKYLSKEEQEKLHQLLFLALEELEENHRGEFPPDVLPVVIF